MTVEFIPNLRSAFGRRPETKTLQAALESKSVAIVGYESVTAINGHSGIMFTSSTRADSWDLERAVTEYEKSVWAYRCIELMSSKAARLNYAAAINRGTDDERPLDPREAIFRVLNKRANPLETARAFKKRQSQQVFLSKKGVFVEVGKTNMATLNRLDLMDPARVRIERSDDGNYINYFEYTTLIGEMKEVKPERVRWIREPHPTDPFAGTTPLEAAGLSVQLDMLSRLYNVSFIQNDARPGGILAINADGLQEQEMNRLERKFSPGAHHAGELEVVATGPGGMNYIDTTTKPRDMAYGEAAKNAKEEVLAAFGIGESVLGNASGRTFDNADAELYGFWTGPMTDHLELIASAYDQDIPEEYDGYFDTSGVPALALPDIKAREEARTEVREGLRSIDEYRPLAKLEKVEIAQTRALWVSPAKAPVPTDPKDRAALGLEPEGGDPAAAEGAPADGGPEGTPQDAVDEARSLDVLPAPGTPEEAVAAARNEGVVDPDMVVDEAAQAVDEARNYVTPSPADKTRALDPRAVVQEARMEGKAGVPGVADTPSDHAAVERLRRSWSHGKMALEIGWGTDGDFDRCVSLATEYMGPEDAKGWCNLRHHDALGIYPATHAKMEGKALDGAGEPVTYDAGEQRAAAAELAIAAALEQLLAKQSGVIAARVEAPKTRQGTKFWTAAYEGDQRVNPDGDLDTAKIINEERWADQLAETLGPILMAESTRQVEDLYGTLEAAGIIASTVAAGTIPAAAAAVAVQPSLTALMVAHDAVMGFLDTVGAVIRNESRVASTAHDVSAKVREHYARQAGSFSRSLASSLAGMTLHAAADAAAAALTPAPGAGHPLGIVRTWRGIPDATIRDTHREAIGQTVALGESFTVGGESLRYPNDPAGSPAETRGCRCRVEYRFAAGQKLLLPPA